MTTINPYVGFNGQCREAMTFYSACLNGELNLMTVGETPMAGECPEAIQGHVMHATLMRGGEVLLMGTDMTSPEGYSYGNNIALSLNCKSEEEINTLYEKFTDGGKVIDPLGVKFWGDLFGVVKDKYGITWMVNYPQKTQSATQQ